MILDYVKLAILMPTHGEWAADFGISLAMASSGLGHNPPAKNFGLKFFMERGSRLAAQRRNLVMEALASRCTHMLFIDTDMSFPGWAIPRLISYDKDIIAANCPKKQFPEAWTAKTNFKEVSSTGKIGVEEVDSVGTAFMLIKAEVFDKVPKPWFKDITSINDKGEIDDVGEDMWFCREARKKGYSIFIDHDLSKEIGHVGSYVYRCAAEVAEKTFEK